MDRRKWIPVAGQKIVDTERYRYVIGVYSHATYGDRCFRISKFLRANGYFVGHFVVTPEDQASVLCELQEYIQKIIRDGFSEIEEEGNSPRRITRVQNYSLPGLGLEDTR
jgi:hypothetical protein